MKLYEPRGIELVRLNGGYKKFISVSKSYLDYLKESDYSSSRKKFCIKQYKKTVNESSH